MNSSPGPPATIDLPEPVRARLVAMVAASLPTVASLPANLRRIADFAPARRAKTGASQILQSLDADDDLRERVGVQVHDRVTRSGGVAEREASESAALAWLVRSEGWEDVLSEALAQLGESGPAPDDDRVVEGLRRRLQKSEQSERELRETHKNQVTELKAEITELRRRLGETRAADRAARAEADAALAEAQDARREVEVRLTGLEKEARQLRSQLARRGEESDAGKRAARDQRDEATMRARLLLETILGSATGLQRELALPPGTGSPGDRFEEQVAGEGARDPSGARALDTADPALLQHYLALPRPHLLVDGYNVSKRAWAESSLEVQRTRLLTGLAALVARTRVETTVVFDAAATSTRPVVTTPRGVRVLFSQAGTIADDVIRDLVAAEPEGRVVVVVTDDRAVLADVAHSGARTAGSQALIQLLRT